jgi:hypothetical protein
MRIGHVQVMKRDILNDSFLFMRVDCQCFVRNTVSLVRGCTMLLVRQVASTLDHRVFLLLLTDSIDSGTITNNNLVSLRRKGMRFVVSEPTFLSSGKRYDERATMAGFSLALPFACSFQIQMLDFPRLECPRRLELLRIPLSSFLPLWLLQ